MPDTSITIGQEYQLDATGKSVPVAVTGSPMLVNTPLLANETVSSGWLERGQFVGAQTILYADTPGSYTVEYSDDGGKTLAVPMVTINYPTVETTRKGAFDITASYIRIVYKNGNADQSVFKFEVRFLSTPAAVSSETLNALGADTRLAMWTKSRIETKDNDNGTYAPIYRHNNALRVYIENPQVGGGGNIVGDVSVTFPEPQHVITDNPVDTSALAKEEGHLKSIDEKDFATESTLQGVLDKLDNPLTVTGDFYPTVQEVSGTLDVNVDFPNIQRVEVENPTDVSQLAKEAGGNLENLTNKDFATQATLLQILEKLPNNPASQATLSSILAKLISSPATEATLNGILTRLSSPLPVVGDFYPDVQTVSGSVNATVNFPEVQTVHVDNFPARESVEVNNFPSNQQVTVTNTPTVNVGTIPAVEIANDLGNPIPIAGTVTATVQFPSTQQVAFQGTPTVNANVQFPGTQPVSLATNTPDVTDRPNRQLGRVQVDSLPAISGSVNATIVGTPSVNANVSFPESQAVTGPLTDSQLRNTPVPVTVTGGIAQGLTDTQLRASLLGVTVSNPVNTVGVNNFPTSQTVNGTVNIGNLPTSTEVSNDVGNPIPVSGSVSISNLPSVQAVSGPLTDVQLRNAPVPVTTTFPASQTVNGTVSVSNFPSTQAVSGSVSATVSNFPSSQAVTAANLPLPMGAATSAKQDAIIAALSPNVPATTGTFQQFTLVAGVAQTLAASSTRKSVKITPTVGTVHIGIGFTATATQYTYRIVANGICEVLPVDVQLSISLFSSTAATVNTSVSS